MRVLRFFGSLGVSILIFLLIPSADQQQTRAYQHWPQHKLYASYWSTERGFNSTLEMKNNRIKETLIARVSIYFTNGEEHTLESLSIAPRQTLMIDIDSVIASLPASRRKRIPREGTVEVEYEGPNATSLMGSVSVTNPAQGIAWSFFLYPAYQATSIAPLQGLFWFPNRKTEGMVLLHNISGSGMTVHPRVEVSGASYLLPDVTLRGEELVKLDLRKALRHLDPDRPAAGGIELTYEGEPDSLRAHGLLFDGQGFSTQVDFNRVVSLIEPQELTYHTPRFAIGEADPILGVPQKTKFEPRLILHHFGDGQLEVVASLSFRNETGPQEVAIPIVMQARETRVMELESHLGGRVPQDAHWAGMEIRYAAKRSSLAMTLVSVSEDRKRSIRSVLNWVQSTSREGWYWRADEDFNTMVGIQNSDREEGNVIFSLDYYVGQTRYSYELPLKIPGRASHLIDIGEIKRGRQPDADGDVIPQEVTFGGYRAVKLHPRGEGPLTTEALLIDRRSGSYLTVYNTGCCEYAWFWPSSIIGPVGANGPIGVEIEDACTGFLSSGIGRYTNFNTSVVTVSSSVASLVGPGSTSISRSVILLKPWSVDPETGQNVCRNAWDVGPPCPVTVKPAVAISGANSFAFVGTHPTVPKVPFAAVVNPTGGTYSWTASNGRVSFDNPTGDLVTLTGNSPSTALGDTTISVTYAKNGQAATAPRVITVRIFKYLTQAGSIQTFPLTYGYDSYVVYNVYTNPGGQVVGPGFSGIAVSETVEVTSVKVNGVEAGVSFNMTTQTGSTNANTEIGDQLRLLSSQPLPIGLDITSNQNLFVGVFFFGTTLFITSHRRRR